MGHWPTIYFSPFVSIFDHIVFLRYFLVKTHSYISEFAFTMFVKKVHGNEMVSLHDVIQILQDPLKKLQNITNAFS